MNGTKLLEAVSESVHDPLQLRNAYLVAENRILCSQIDSCVRLTDCERKELAGLGAQLGKKALVETAIVAKADTTLAWNRKFADQQLTTSVPSQSIGRPHIDKETELGSSCSFMA